MSTEVPISLPSERLQRSLPPPDGAPRRVPLTASARFTSVGHLYLPHRPHLPAQRIVCKTLPMTEVIVPIPPAIARATGREKARLLSQEYVLERGVQLKEAHKLKLRALRERISLSFEP